MPQIYDMGPPALLSLRRKACWGFFALKNPKASAVFELANLGTRGQHASSRPPKPLNKVVILCCNFAAYSLQYLRFGGYKFSGYIVIWKTQMQIAWPLTNFLRFRYVIMWFPCGNYSFDPGMLDIRGAHSTQCVSTHVPFNYCAAVWHYMNISPDMLNSLCLLKPKYRIC
jgi:hypothetical protein